MMISVKHAVNLCLLKNNIMCDVNHYVDRIRLAENEQPRKDIINNHDFNRK
jgi:hypothetical protein